MATDFGAKASALTGLRIYEQASRGSGRTETTLRSLKDGDILVAHDEKSARHLERQCKERGLDVRVTTIRSIRMNGHAGAKGRLVFDHAAVLAMYEEAIQGVDKEIAEHGAAMQPDKEVRPVASYALIDHP